MEMAQNLEFGSGLARWVFCIANYASRFLSDGLDPPDRRSGSVQQPDAET
jgi:hypothetical protein